MKLVYLKVSIKEWIKSNIGLVESLKAKYLEEMQVLDKKENLKYYLKWTLLKDSNLRIFLRGKSGKKK